MELLIALLRTGGILIVAPMILTGIILVTGAIIHSIKN